MNPDSTVNITVTIIWVVLLVDYYTNIYWFSANDQEINIV